MVLAITSSVQFRAGQVICAGMLRTHSQYAAAPCGDRVNFGVMKVCNNEAGGVVNLGGGEGRMNVAIYFKLPVKYLDDRESLVCYLTQDVIVSHLHPH